MIYKAKSIIVLVLFISISGFSQSVETFVEMAKEYNPGLKALKLEYNAALMKADQVNDWPDPTVNVGLGVLPIETRLGAQRLRIGATQMIPWKGSLDAKSNVARAMAEEKFYADEVKVIDIEFAIRSAYTTLVFLEANKAIILKRLNILDALEELAKSAVTSGKGKLSNVLFTERTRNLLTSNLNLLEIKKEQPTIMINRWAGRELDAEIQISTDELSNISKAEVLTYAEERHPQYNILDNKVAASNSVIELTKYQAKPKIGVGLDYAYIEARSDMNPSGNGRDVLMPMGSISIPLNKGRFKAIKQEEAIRQEAIKAQREEVKDMFRAEIEMAYSTIEYNNEIVNKYQALKEITIETLKLMRSEYASEGTRFEELLRLEMELIDYDLEILTAEYEINMAMVTLYKFI
jgi:outer membrane protein TolC